MKILVTGSRDWNRYLPIVDALVDFVKYNGLFPSDVTLIHGDCPTGADAIAKHIAEEMGMNVKPYPAHWKHTEKCEKDCSKVQGRAAGPIRNQQMIDENPDIVKAFAFHEDLENSKGTKDIVNRLKKAKIPYLHYV